MNSCINRHRLLIRAVGLAVGVGLAVAGCGQHSAGVHAAGGPAPVAAPSAPGTAPSTGPSSSVDGDSPQPNQATPVAGTEPSGLDAPVAKPTAKAPPPVVPSSPSRPSAPPSGTPSIPPLPVGATTIVPTAWLAAAQLPGSGSLHWQNRGAPRATDDTQRLQQDLWTPWCGGLTGFSSRQQSDFAGGTAATTGSQYLFTFPSADAASAAYQKVAGSRASCVASWGQLQTQRGMTADAVAGRTAAAPAASAWTWRWTGVITPMTTAGPQIDHEYLLQRGSMLVILDLAEPLAAYSTPSVITAQDDSAVLQSLAAHLCAGYAQTCQ